MKHNIDLYGITTVAVLSIWDYSDTMRYRRIYTMYFAGVQWPQTLFFPSFLAH